MQVFTSREFVFICDTQMINARRSTGDIDAEKAFSIDEELAIIHTAKKFSMLGTCAACIIVVLIMVRRVAEGCSDARG